MAVNYGKDGYITINDVNVVHVNSWEMNIPMDALEQTAFGDSWDRTYVPGLRAPTATFSGYYEDTDTGQYTAVAMFMSTSTPSTCDVQLLYYHPTTATYAGFAGGAVLTGLTLGAAVDGIQTLSGTLQFDGGVHTTAETS